MMKSFLMIGQSNMAGRGLIHEVPPIYNENIKMLRNGRWQMMTEPINYDRPVSGIGLAGSFSAAWCRQNQGDTIGLIPCAEGGSAIDEWAVDGPLFKHAVSEAKFAMRDSELAGILWHQGESDSNEGKYKGYAEKLRLLLEALREQLQIPEIPVIIGGLGEFLGKTGFGRSCPEYQLMNQELQTFAANQEHCYFVTAADLTSNSDGIHFDAISQRRFGVRYFEAFWQRQHILEPLANENEQLELEYQRILSPTEQLYLKSLDLGLGKISYDEFEAQLVQFKKQQGV